MKQKIEGLLAEAFRVLKTQGIFDAEFTATIIIERPRDESHGDFSSNLALTLAKAAKMNPRQLAEKIVSVLPPDPAILKVELAGPGFINFFVNPNSQYDIIKRIHEQGKCFGLSAIGAGKNVQVEFVSANPTGPLHVGHGRGAAYGSVVANLLEAVGFNVQREYYVNDAGRQMDILATSIWLRYLEVCGETLPFPSNAYRGDYIRDIAQEAYEQFGNQYQQPFALVLDELPTDEPQGGDKEVYIDALIARSKQLLGDDGYKQVFKVGLDNILADIRDDLEGFGVSYQNWFSEQSLIDNNAVKEAIDRLQAGGHLYEKSGALWFASSKLGDEKDRVVVRDNGIYTYFATDIAYHMEKLDRGFDKIINIWGADHHGYIPRVKAALKALGADENKLSVLLVQFATLYRGEEKVQMSTRSGDFVTLRELREETGKDAARFFYVMRRSEQHMDFDLELATSKTNENPVFYVQYAYARVCSVLRQLAEKGGTHDITLGMAHLALLAEEHELDLLGLLSRYPEVIERAALHYEPHQLIQYVRELAAAFHTYYNAHQFLVENAQRRNARLNLICAIQQVLANALGLLGVSAPETM